MEDGWRTRWRFFQFPPAGYRFLLRKKEARMVEWEVALDPPLSLSSLHSQDALRLRIMELFYASLLTRISLCLSATPRMPFLSLNSVLAMQQKASAFVVLLVRFASPTACALLESVNSTAAPVPTKPTQHQYVHRSATVVFLSSAHLFVSTNSK